MKGLRLIKKGFILLIFLILSLSVLSSGLAEEKIYPVPKECMDQVRKEGNKLNMYNWAEWWPEEIYESFTKEFGVKVVLDYFADYDEMVTKFRLNPKLEYDLTLPDVRPFMQMKELGVLRKLNHDWIPNVNAYLPEETKSMWYDPGYQYTVVPNLSFIGYGYNSKFVDPNDSRIPSWKMLFEAEDYKGRITMVDDMFLVIGCALKYLGLSYNSDNEEELMQARDVVLRQKPWVMAYDSWPKRMILEEEAWISQTWLGDAWFLYQDLETFRPALPPEGTEFGRDLLVIPQGAPHPAAGHLFMNYLFRPEVHAVLIKAIGHAPNHTVTAQILPEEMRKWPGTVTSKEYLEKCDLISPKAFTGKGLELRTKIWEELKQ